MYTVEYLNNSVSVCEHSATDVAATMISIKLIVTNSRQQQTIKPLCDYISVLHYFSMHGRPHMQSEEGSCPLRSICDATG